MYIVAEKKKIPVNSVDEEEIREGFKLPFVDLEIPIWVLLLIFALIILSAVGIYFALTYSSAESDAKAPVVESSKPVTLPPVTPSPSIVAPPTASAASIPVSAPAAAAAPAAAVSKSKSKSSKSKKSRSKK